MHLVWILCALFVIQGSASDDATSPAQTDKKPGGLVGIASREAARARKQLCDDARQIFNELETNADPEVRMVQERITRLAGMGPAILPVLREQMTGDMTFGRMNRATSAARVLARLLVRQHSNEVEAAVEEGLTAEDPLTRGMTARAVGYSGLLTFADKLEALLDDSNPNALSHAILALGNINAQKSADKLSPFLSSDEEIVRVSALRALCELNLPASKDVILPMVDEEWTNDKCWVVLFGYAGQHGNLNTIQSVGRFLDSSQSDSVRVAAADCLKVIGLRTKGAASNRAITLLKPELSGSAASEFVQHVARCLFALGDESGLERLIEDDTAIIRQTPNGFRAYLARAETYYSFQQYSDAISDCKDSMRNDRRGVLEEKARILTAACYAGLKNFRSAKGHLTKIRSGGFSRLLAEYPEFEAMAKDSKYRNLFE